MTVTALMNRAMILVQRSTNPSTEDVFGNVMRVEVQVPIVGELQQTQATEPPESGELSDARWNLYVPHDVDITTGDGVLVDGELYEVVGDPWRVRNPRTQQFSHMECRLRRTAMDGDETS